MGPDAAHTPTQSLRVFVWVRVSGPSDCGGARSMAPLAASWVHIGSMNSGPRNFLLGFRVAQTRPHFGVLRVFV